MRLCDSVQMIDVQAAAIWAGVEEAMRVASHHQGHIRALSTVASVAQAIKLSPGPLVKKRNRTGKCTESSSPNLAWGPRPGRHFL